jgi:hypothetical protein
MKLFNPKSWKEKFNINPSYNQLFETFLSEKKFLSQNQILKLYFTYDKIILNSQKKLIFQLNSQLFLITKEPQNWLCEMSNFSFLKKKINETLQN